MASYFPYCALPRHLQPELFLGRPSRQSQPVFFCRAPGRATGSLVAAPFRFTPERPLQVINMLEAEVLWAFFCGNFQIQSGAFLNTVSCLMAEKVPTRRAWTPDHVRTLKTLARKKTGAARIAKTLKRTEGATRKKAFSLGLSLDSQA